MTGAALTFGSFGDIVTVAQLVSELYNALGDISDAPSEIMDLSEDLNSYLLVLPHVRRVLLEPESYFEPETRAGIEHGLKRCMDTLLAIRRHVDAFAAGVQHRAGRRILLAYTAAVRWRVLGGRKDVATLHARLDKQISFVSMCLGVSQSHGQRALHDAAKRNEMAAEQMFLMVRERPPEIDAGASVLQIYDCYSRSSYQAFAVVPVRMLPTYLDPLITLLEPAKLKSPYFGGISFRDPRFLKSMKPKAHLSGFDTIIEMHCPWERPGYTRSIVFQFSIFSVGSGEEHVLLGVRPSYQKDAVSLVLSDVLRGEFPCSDNVESYVAEMKKMQLLQSVMENYCVLLRIAHRPARSLDDDWRCPVRALAYWLDGYTNPNILEYSTISDAPQNARHQVPHRVSQSEMHQRLWDLLDSNPGAAESRMSTQSQLRRIAYAPMPMRLAALFDLKCIRIEFVTAMFDVAVAESNVGVEQGPRM